MKDVTSRWFIYSVFQNSVNDKINEDNHVAEIDYINKEYSLNSRSILGQFEGKKELSILVQGDNNLEAIIQDRMKKYNQKCYLIVYHDGAVESVNNIGERQQLGQFVEVHEDIVTRDKRDFSLINGRYYIIQTK